MRRALLVLVFLAGCAPADPCATLDDLSDGGLELDAAHPGWGRATCLQCHAVTAFHVRDCFGEAAIDVTRLDEHLDLDDPTTCVPCHGANGVPGLQALPDTGGPR